MNFLAAHVTVPIYAHTWKDRCVEEGIWLLFRLLGPELSRSLGCAAVRKRQSLHMITYAHLCFPRGFCLTLHLQTVSRPSFPSLVRYSYSNMRSLNAILPSTSSTLLNRTDNQLVVPDLVSVFLSATDAPLSSS